VKHVLVDTYQGECVSHAWDAPVICNARAPVRNNYNTRVDSHAQIRSARSALHSRIDFRIAPIKAGAFYSRIHPRCYTSALTFNVGG